MRYVIFGESHGPAIGVVLEGVPAGLELDLERVSAEMARRAPGGSPLSTARKEADVPEILSGLFEGRTTGTPLCAVIANTDTRSRDYAKLKDLPRPGHGDYAGYVRYQGCNDYRGGGHFSGRLTAPLAILPDVGMFASFDPVALDQACVDACLRQQPIPGSLLDDRMHEEGFHDLHDHFRNVTPECEWESCLAHGEKIGLGQRAYELISMK